MVYDCDCRPSDACWLAIRTGAPIMVHRDVWDGASVHVGDLMSMRPGTVQQITPSFQDPGIQMEVRRSRQVTSGGAEGRLAAVSFHARVHMFPRLAVVTRWFLADRIMRMDGWIVVEPLTRLEVRQRIAGSTRAVTHGNRSISRCRALSSPRLSPRSRSCTKATKVTTR